MKTTKCKLLSVAIIMLTLLNAAYTQPLNKEKLDQFFDKLAEKNKGMGSLSLVRNGEVIYSRSIGYSQINGTEKKPLTAINRFRIGSITKMFTAAIVMQLVDEKKLNLTDTLAKFFPQIPNAGKITITQIFQHRSGIPNVKRPDNAQGNVNTTPMTKDEILALIVNAKPDFEPGTKHVYSNSGYQVFGLIIEKITGKSYEQVLNERIISKIGLKDTYIATGNIDVNKKEALTYMNLGGEWRQMPETHPSVLFSAGAIISTPTDLAKFIQALFDGKIVSKESLEQMKTMKEGDGFGMQTFTYGGKTFYGHTGGADNYGAWLAYLPEEKLTMAYASNAKVYPVGNIVDGVMNIYYNEPFQIPTFEAIAVSTETLDKYVGIYSTTEAPVKFTITREGTTLFIKPGADNAAPLEAVDDHTFKIEGAIVVEFDAAKNQMTIKRNGGQRVFIKEK